MQSKPLGIKYLENEEDIKQIEKVRRPEMPLTWCQIISTSRHIGTTLAATADDLSLPGCILQHGFAPRFGQLLGAAYAGVWVKEEEDAKKYAQTLRQLPLGKYKAVVVSPLILERFPPDIILIYGNSAQMNLLLNALQWEKYERFQFYFSGEGSCTDSTIECYHSGKPQLTVPCFGERIQGCTQDNELELAIPATMLKKAVDGLNALRAARTVAYPIPYIGFQMNTEPFIARVYKGLAEITKELKAKSKSMGRD